MLIRLKAVSDPTKIKLLLQLPELIQKGLQRLPVNRMIFLPAAKKDLCICTVSSELIGLYMHNEDIKFSFRLVPMLVTLLVLWQIQFKKSFFL